MIAGPILPRTPEGLWDVVRSEPDRLERGLRLVRRELVLDGGLVVDALGADAVGRPVLMFGAWVDRDRSLPGRIADARDWFGRNARMLGGPLEGSGVRLDLPARVFVVGFDFTESCLDRLRSAADPDLAAFRVEGFYVDGVRHLGAVRLLGGAASGSGTGLEGAPGGDAARLVGRLEHLLERLDPELAIDREPYARTWRLGGTTVARLERGVRALTLVVPGGEGELPIRTDDDVADAVDAAMRRYLEVLVGAAGAEGAECTRVHSAVGVGPGAVEVDRGARGAGDLGVRGLTAFGAEITPDEYEAFFQQDPRGGGA